MIKINLLPFRIARTKENIRRQVSLFLLLFILSLLILVWFHLNLNNRIKDAEATITATKTEMERYTKINQQIIKLRENRDILQKKTGVISMLETNRFEPVRLLDKMTQAIISHRMWFEKLTFQTGRVGVTGMALDEKTIVDFMKQLERTGIFHNVNLMTLKEKKFDKGLKLKNFAISCETAMLAKTSEKEAKDE